MAEAIRCGHVTPESQLNFILAFVRGINTARGVQAHQTSAANLVRNNRYKRATDYAKHKTFDLNR